MKYAYLYLTFILLFGNFHGISQNLVMNPEFEVTNICKEYNSTCNAANWISTSEFYPDYRGENNKFVKLIAFNSTKQNVRDYIQTQLLCDMIEGEEYEITVAIKQGDCVISSLGILFSDQIYYRKTNELIEVEPSIDFGEQLSKKSVKDQKEWVMLTTTYVANGTEKFMLIGNFQTDKEQKRNYVLEEKQFVSYRYSLDHIYVKRVNEEALCDLSDSVQKHWDNYRYRHTPIRLMPYIPGEIIDDTLVDVPITEEPPRIDSITLSDVIFDFNSDILTDSAQIIIDEEFSLMNIDEVEQIFITGHTDNVGKATYNNDLSLRRAEAVKNYLVEMGYYDNLINTEGKGAQFPIADNSTAEGRQQNRRIEIKIIYR